MTRCHDIRTRADAYARGLLPREEAAAVEAHAAGCPDCAAGLAALRALPARPAGRPLPEGYAESLLVRVRQRIDSRRGFQVPAFAVRFAAPALALVLLALLAGNLVQRTPAADAGALLAALPEDDLAELALAHDSGALITLPADQTETSAPDVDEADLLTEIVAGDDTSAVAAYVDTDLAVADLGDEEQTELLALLDTH
jgi:hypothetical protein